MIVLDDIIEWSLKQDDWKQDLIRRIIENGDYTDKDVDEIAKMLLFNSGYVEKMDVTPKLIDKAKNTTIKTFKDKKVVLQKVEKLANVNALCSNSSLSFAQDGLTVIYGENGVGKSGYTRVLKKVCKAREIEPVLPNIYTDKNEGKVGADFYYSVDDKDLDIAWDDSKGTVDYLDQIVVHDSKCAKVQVNGSNELYYLPGGADIFSKIIDFIEEVKDKLEKYKPGKVTLDLGKVNTDTVVYKLLSGINSSTKSEDLKSALDWNESNENELNAVVKRIIDANEEGVRKTVKSLENQQRKLDRVKKDVLEINHVLCTEKLASLVQKNKQREETKKALKEISEEVAKNSKIESTGGDLWRLMYDAAKNFSECEVYTDKEFPNVDGVCVLCQQDLNDESKKRLEGFKKYIEGQVSRKYDELEKWYQKSFLALGNVGEKIKTLKEGVVDLDGSIPESEYDKLSRGIEGYELNLQTFYKHLESIDYEGGELLTVDSEIVLDKIVANINAEILETKKSIDPKVLNTIKQRREELNAHKIANSLLPQIENYVNYLIKAKRFEDMQKLLETGSISRKGKTIITDALRKTFLDDLKSELEGLGGKRIPLHVNSLTKGGEPNFKLSLDGADLPKKCDLDAILSEGEQKIVSIAGFLAELKLAKHTNGIIFDDPVTSLDHTFKEKIAKRLANEALKRQVIIFTHDISFLFDLTQKSIEMNVPTLIQNIKKDGDISGVISNQNPWHSQRTRDRITTLKDMHLELKKACLEGLDYNKEAGTIYGRLRETWERFIEEVLLNEVVTRFGQSVQAQRLGGVYIADDDFNLIFHEMGKASKFMVGHDKSLPVSDSRPGESELLADIERLASYLKETNKKISDRAKERKMAVSEPPKAKVML